MALGAWLDWPLSRSVLIGFVISLSSTAMVLRLLQYGRAAKTRIGEQVTGILLAQDIAIVPMLVVLGLLRGEAPDAGRIVVQIAGAALFVGLLVWIARRGELRLGIGRLLGRGHEMQVFAALIVAVGLSLLTDLAGLSTALGALLAGMVISAAKETHWVHESLEPFRVVFVALFFLSVGMLLDLRFLAEHWALILVLTVLAFLTNTFINFGILRGFGSSWRHSLYGGALLAQIGELSYVVAAVGRQAAIVSDFADQATVCIITLTLRSAPWSTASWRCASR
ncbi:MAG: cation:proton antiporter domain-containing protein [Planctomycetota bacterium]